MLNGIAMIAKVQIVDSAIPTRWRCRVCKCWFASEPTEVRKPKLYHWECVAEKCMCYDKFECSYGNFKQIYTES